MAGETVALTQHLNLGEQQSTGSCDLICDHAASLVSPTVDSDRFFLTRMQIPTMRYVSGHAGLKVRLVY